MRSARHIARRRGTETIEFMVTLAVMLMVMSAVISLFAAFANALVAQHALSQTAIYAASNGRFTVKAQERCLELMPAIGSQGQTRCRLLRPDGSEIPPSASAAEAIPAPFGTPLTLEVSYRQPWFLLCVDPEGCGRAASTITRRIDLLSLTQQRTGR